MASSTVEVREAEPEVPSFGLTVFEENGIATSQIDGEPPKDHNYTKLDTIQNDESKNDDDDDDEEADLQSEKKPEKAKDGGDKTARSTRGVKPQKSTKRSAKSPVKKASSPKKGRQAPIKKDKGQKAESIEDDAEDAIVADPANNSFSDVEMEQNKRGRKRKVEEDGGAEPRETSADSAADTLTDTKVKGQKRGQKKKSEGKENVVDGVELADNGVDEGNPRKMRKRDAVAVKATQSPKNKKVSEPPAKRAAKKKQTTAQIEGAFEEDTQNLPKGWVKRTVVRKTGKTAGQTDVYIYSPDGFKFRSKPDVAAYLARTKSSLKIGNFDFSKKKSSDVAAKPAVKKLKSLSAKSGEPVEKKKVAPVSSPSKKLVVKLKYRKKGAKTAGKKGPSKGGKASPKVSKESVRKSKGSKKKKTA